MGYATRAHACARFWLIIKVVHVKGHAQSHPHLQRLSLGGLRQEYMSVHVGVFSAHARRHGSVFKSRGYLRVVSGTAVHHIEDNRRGRALTGGQRFFARTLMGLPKYDGTQVGKKQSKKQQTLR